jgi:hypothetical protein
MANTYTAIATVTVGSGGAANIEFTSIPATYTDLQLLVSGRDNDGGYGSAFHLTFNGTGWSGNKELYSYGGTAGSGTTSGELAGTGNGATANTFGNASVYIPNYTGSNSKSISSESVTENNNANNAYLVFHAGNSGVTAAITSISITPGGTLFLQHSTATLYGIKKS